MKNKILKAIEISKAMRPEYQTGRAFHTTFAMVKNKIVAIGVDDYNTCHPYHLFGHYEDHKNYTDSYDGCND